MAYFSPAKPLQRRGSPITSRVFDSARPRRRILRGYQFNTPGTTVICDGSTNLLLPPGEGLYKQNQGKLWYSIPAVVQIIYAPALVWERGARCFAGRFFVWAPDGTRGCSVFWQMDYSETSSCRRGTVEPLTPYALRSITVFPQPGWFENVIPSTMARDYLSNGMDGCQGAPWSEELDGKELHGAAGGDMKPRESDVFCTSSTWSSRLSPYTSVVLW